MKKRKEKMTVSPRQMIANTLLLLTANLADEVITKIGLSLGFEERGITPAIIGMKFVWHWKWLVCFTLITSLFAAWRKPKIRWFLTQVVFLVAAFLLLAQLYNLFLIVRG